MLTGPSYITRDMQIKAAVRHHHTLLEWPESRILARPSADEDMEQ